MTAIETRNAARTALANAPTDEVREKARAALDAAERNVRREEILAMPAGLERDALLAPLGADLEEVAIPEISPQEQVLPFYLTRQALAPNVVARWGTYNHVQLATGAWDLDGFRTLKDHGKAIAAERAVRQGSWGEGYAILASFTTQDHPLATPETVAAYLGAMVAEGFVPA